RGPIMLPRQPPAAIHPLRYRVPAPRVRLGAIAVLAHDLADLDLGSVAHELHGEHAAVEVHHVPTVPVHVLEPAAALERFVRQHHHIRAFLQLGALWHLLPLATLLAPAATRHPDHLAL